MFADPLHLFGGGAGDLLLVVIHVGGAGHHRQRGVEHAFPKRGEQVVLLVDHVRPVGAGQFELVRHGQRPGGACLDAVAAEDAPQIVDRYGRVYQINYLRCIFCGYCIEACPTRALTMTNEFELASTNRADMIYEKDDLLAPLREGMLNTPLPMVPGTTDVDYYQEKVTGPTPEQVEWVREHRPDDESLEAAAKAAGSGTADRADALAGQRQKGSGR